MSLVNKNMIQDKEISREIEEILPKKYIAKDKDSDRWFVGYYFRHKKNNPSPLTSINGELVQIEYEHYLIFDEMADWGLEPKIKVVSIDINTLEIYIGVC